MIIACENIAAESTATVSLIDLLCDHLAVLWKDWPRNMQVSVLDEERNKFSLRGECPHCRHATAFLMVTNPYVDPDTSGIYAAMKCQGCLKHILGIVGKAPKGIAWAYRGHYPAEAPNDDVASEIPAPIASDFQEAIRCKSIRAFRATVLMCRRSLQASCDKEGAEGKDLFTQIDDLRKKGRITEPLQKLAHAIRLIGKRGAHGDYFDIDDSITEQDADDALTFMHHYFEHVYVMPASWEKFDASRRAATAKT